MNDFAFRQKSSLKCATALLRNFLFLDNSRETSIKTEIAKLVCVEVCQTKMNN
jgi:hypothetical protein